MGSGSNKESFTEMIDATTRKPGLIGRLFVVSLIVVSIAITAFVGDAIMGGTGSQSYVNGNQYQAVFLTNGQVYFGKLSNIQTQYAVLEDVWYPRVDDTSKKPQSLDIIKRGEELHGPEDRMVINTEQIMFWENLKSSGTLTKRIQEFKDEEAKKAAADAAKTTEATTSEAPGTTEAEN